MKKRLELNEKKINLILVNADQFTSDYVIYAQVIDFH